MPTAAEYRDTHREIVLGCQRKDRNAQRQLYSHYAKPMYNLCLRMLKHSHDAEDVLQVAFVTIFSRIDTFNFEASISAWIKRVVVNRCIDHLKKRRLLTIDLDPGRHEAAAVVDEPVYSEENGYTVERIKRAMDHLSEGYRVVLTLYLFEGYDHEEIAQILGISPGTSKSQYSRARKRLAQLLIENKPS
ncbi:RNA polymerase sigma-70 factor (ECF subfamily) [Lewinella marina]|uniref:RNA polymerase sigma factor n=1 Tax=Neolewinella marina TaxID=438751 RepID=A0A2G0CDS1_9BACT|nr:sigma-70 family RNA polymerase sigma factor [Neolewinella marina]NJB85900.1 RNA polymerase sigma-70 factor (ECF subfamily) [Neolewinella marina]PHK98123.1 RNA polymerase [Neolewinella marina]